MKTKILAVILAVAMLVSMLPISAVVSAAGNDITEDFSTKDKWEDIVGTYFSTKVDNEVAAQLKAESSIVDIDGKSTLLPVQAGRNRGGYVTVLKDEYWPSDKKVQSFSTTFLAETISSFDNNTQIFVYAPMGNIGEYGALNYNALAIEIHKANNGTTLNWKWQLYYWNAEIGYVTHSVGSQNDTKIELTEWIKLTITYDYSKLSENQLVVGAVFSKADGTDATAQKDYTLQFDVEPSSYEGMEASAIKDLNIYKEGFKVGIGSTGTGSGLRQSSIYFDDFAVEFEKTVADEANDFKTKHAYALLELEEINSSGDFDAVEAAIAEYETLGEDVKELLSTEISKLNFLMNDFDATCFKEDNAEVLALQTVATNAQASSVLAAIAAYAELDGDVKALLTEQITKLNELKATIKITEFDFEDEALFVETWESAPDADIWHETGGITESTRKQEAQIIAEADGNNVVAPEVRSTTRKRRLLTVKESYLKDGEVTSFSTDMRIDAGNSADRNPGIYYYFKDQYNWERLEFATGTDNYTIRVAYASGNSESAASSLYSISKDDTAAGGVIKAGDWINVKVDYTYSDEGTTVNFTFTNKNTNEDYTLSVESPRFNGDVRVGYGAGGNVADLFYFDNFALTYASEEPEVTPEDLAAEFNTKYEAVLTKDVIGDDDVATVDAAIAEYDTLDEEVQTLLADSIEKLNTLKADYLAAREAAEFNSNYGEALDLEAITSDIEYDAVDAALGAYILLDDSVKAIVNLDVAKYQAMMSDYLSAKQAAEDAATYNATYGETLTLEVITSDAEYEAVTQAIVAYNELDDAVKDIIKLDVSKYEDMMNAYDAEKANKAAAAEYESVYAVTFEITVITNDTELEAVDAAVTAYKALDPAVQAFVTVDIAKYEGLIADYNIAKANKEAAAEYETTHADALALETINSQVEYDMVVAAITAYNELGDGAKALLADDTLTKLEALKADYDEYLTADYTPVIKGATIRRSGTQTLAFRCAVGAVNTRKQVVDCGIIVTANSYITDGYVNSKDLVVDSTNDLVIVAPLDDVSNITSGYEFTVNIGNISSRNYGVRYVAKVFVKYSDGTIEYSETATKSVISVAKAIATWTFENYEAIDNEYGVGNIAEIITDIDENGKITYAYDVTTDNGVKILEYLEANNEAIAVAYNALKNAQ